MIGPFHLRLTWGLSGIVAVLLLLMATMVCGVASAPPIPATKRITSDGGFKQHLHFSPDGKRLLFTRIHKGKMGVWTLELASGMMKPLLIPDPNTPHFDAHFSPEGKSVIFVLDILHGTDGKLQINRCDADGKNSTVLIPHKAFEESPRWSPDGKRFAWVTTRDGNQEIYTANVKGQELRRLTNDNAMDNNPAWSPDGKKLAFSSSRYGNFEILSMNADGSEIQRLTNHPSVDMWPAWSPDGKQIAFTTNRDGNYEIYLMNVDGSNPRNLTRHPASENYPAWSPDGRRLAFISTRHGGHDIYWIEFP